MGEEPATREEIEMCLKEARENYPDASDDEIWKIGAEIYERNR